MLFILASLSALHAPVGKMGGYQKADVAHIDNEVTKFVQSHLRQHSLDLEKCEIVDLETQVVAGLNYRLTIQCPQRDPFTVTVYKKLNKTLQITSSDLDKKEM